MAKYYGKVGYVDTIETDPVNHPGVIAEAVIDEHYYYGDILQNNRRFEKGDGLNDDLNIRNEISILADPFAMKHFAKIRYIEWLGSRWKVTDVKVEYPRLILTVGGVYNGPEPESEPEPEPEP